MKVQELKKEKVKKQKPNSGKSESIWNRDISFSANKLSDKDKLYIYHQLFNLIESGIDIRYSFEILENQIRAAKTKEKISGLRQEIIEGKSFSAAMRDSKYFTSYEYYSVQIGEETGKLGYVLEQLSNYFEERLNQRRQIVSALSYPILILFSSMGAVAFMMFFIIPMFDEVFKRFGSELPAITQAIISFSTFLTGNFWYILGALVSLVLLNFYFNTNRTLSYYKESVILRLPLIGEIYQKIYLSRFCTSMALLISSEVPLISSLEMISNMINFQHLEKPVAQIKSDIMGGKSLFDAMKPYKIFSHEMIALVKVGEEIGKLGSFFDKLAKNYTEDVKHKTGLLNTVLEPAMIIFLGLVVGIILIAMYLPMFELSTEISR